MVRRRGLSNSRRSPDITVYELAQAIPLLIWANDYGSYKWQELKQLLYQLPPNVSRHLEITER